MPSSDSATAVGATASVADFVTSTPLDQIPDDVVAHARVAILDTVGAMLAATDFPIGRIVVDHVAELGGRPVARVAGTDLLTNAAQAALANGTLAHALDFDDHKHLSTHTLPAAIAVGELVGADTADVLRAYVLGREVGAKLGGVIEARRKEHAGPTYRGWYRVGVVGPVAAAVSAGVVLGLSAQQMRAAIGIAASSSSGLRRNQGTMAKALHAGNAASSGVHAAMLADRGFTADETILEAELGLVQAICLPGEADWSVLARLGDPYDLASFPGIKGYPACSPSHKPVAAALRVRDQYGPAALAPDDIVTIEADQHSFSLMRPDPREAIATGFSLPYLVSVALLDGSVGLDQVGDGRLDDPAVRAMMAKVAHDPDAASPGQPERVTVRLRDGRALVGEQHTKPDLREEVSVVDKFRRCAGRVLRAGATERLREALWAFPGPQSVAAVMRLTAAGAQEHAEKEMHTCL